MTEQDTIDSGKAEITEEDQMAIGRKVLGIVQKAFGKLPSDDDQARQTKIARRTVKALAAAHLALEYVTVRLRKENRGWVFLNLDAHQIVATAFWFWMQEVEVSPEETYPETDIGSKLLGFHQGLSAARSATDATYLLEFQNDCEEIYTSSADRLLEWVGDEDGDGDAKAD
ncbi:MAG: hypothetical protein IPL15_23860 [Comamonadaceae bacterium]|jgi:hypothetical protein|uniref:hypothetical protein n=1 Tax=Candidatus Skiveiella danica TaxID=3386177 RepID=UPI003908E3F5|nr:hypothetical protein [Comamonadaceae bacterium]